MKDEIKPEQYKELSEKKSTMETPQAVREKKVPKPRAKKKTKQSDIAIIPMESEASSKLPKGKAIKK